MFSNLSNLFTLQNLYLMLLRLPCILIALTVHECAHGYIAYKLGDPTPKALGRLSLNPLKHLDPIGALCMVFLGVGWAKPVQINSRYFKKPKRDMALTALAGPLSNIILAFIGLFLMAIVGAVPVYGTFMDILYTFLYVFHLLNLYLGIFNLIPVPPLDGSRLLFVFLPDKYYFGIMKYERIIGLVFLILLWTGLIITPVAAVAGWVSKGMAWLIDLIPVFNISSVFI